MSRRRIILTVLAVAGMVTGMCLVGPPWVSVRSGQTNHMAPRTRLEARRTGVLESAMVTKDNRFLSQLRQHGLVDLPSREELKKMTKTHLSWTYHSYIDNVNILCHRKLRMGRIGDGGWEICDDEAFRPTKNCLVYSFGINHDFTFDDDIAKFYRCQVWSFDPSMNKPPHQRPSSVVFLPLGVSARSYVDGRSGWSLATLTSIKHSLNHTGRTIDVLKMDVEGAEWESLRHMIRSHDLSRVKQLLVEFHLYGDFKNKTAGVVALETLADIHNLGFRKFYVHKNPGRNLKKHTFKTFRTPLYEVHYVNINLSRVS